ncbi:hypothetical protein RHMOL_Rhmol06G0162600 [Rhododendron molle]|uniref:Uncharacterized protein n=1 Tax=Rhododendron molle TaxID=49168 RepID=A0ACC0NE25_RHOML|nr:hypothetical protein RHMOL_Rhmol06G0162600 [Rhododendron molle]
MPFMMRDFLVARFLGQFLHLKHNRKAEAVFSTYIHALIRNKMRIVQNAVLSSDATSECHGSMDREFSSMEASFSSGICDHCGNI